MAITLDSDDHDKLGKLLRRILDWHSAGELDKYASAGMIGYLFGAAATDNEEEVRSWIDDPAVVERWKTRLAQPKRSRPTMS